MSEAERDGTHVEQHGDGDVNIVDDAPQDPAGTDAGQEGKRPAPAESGGEPAE